MNEGSTTLVHHSSESAALFGSDNVGKLEKGHAGVYYNFLNADGLIPTCFSKNL